MKKTLVALAAVSAVSAFAQSSVTMYGVIDQGYYSKKSDLAGTANSRSGIGDDLASSHGEGGLSGSRIGFKGTEDLGGGSTANFVYEFGLFPSEKANYTPNSGTAMRIRQAYVSLASGAGELQVGRVYSHVWATQNGDYDFGLNNGMYGYIAGLNGSGNRQANAINYISPSMNGFTAGVLLGFGETATTAGTALSTTTGDKLDEVTSFSLAYRGGPLKVNFANEKTKNHTLHDLYTGWADTSGTAYAAKYQLTGVAAAATTAAGAPDTTVNALGVAYQVGNYKLGYHNSTMALQGDTSFNSSTDLKVSVASYSGEATFGNTVLFGSISKASNNKASQVTVNSSQLGARYLLSKRTEAYYIMGSNRVAISGDTDYAKQSGNVVGIRHQF